MMEKTKIAMWLLLLPLIIYLGILVFIYFSQRRMLYFPSHEDTAHVGTSVFHPFRDQNNFPLGYVRLSENPTRALLMFHGNAGEAIHREWLSELISDPQILLVLAVYPGYGVVPGTPTQRNLLNHANRIFDEIQRRWAVPTTVLGESLGAGVAVWLAAIPGHKAIDRLALITPFYSMGEVAARHYPWLPVRFLLKDSYPAGDWIASVTVPIHMIHGIPDTLIPIAQARKLFEAAGTSEKTLSELPHAGHNSIVEPILHSSDAAAFRDFVRN